MKGTARVLNLPESMRDRYDLIDGKIVKKANPSKKLPKKRKDRLSAGQIILVLFLTIGFPVIRTWINSTELQTKEELCLELYAADLFTEARESKCYLLD